MNRGEIYLADLMNQKGSEQSGIRPVVMVQNQAGNNYAPTTIICPITSRCKTKIPTHVVISPQNSDVTKKSIILCEQIRVIDKSRLKKKLGEIKNKKVIEELNKKLLLSIGVI